MVWYSMSWYGVSWYFMVWYGMVCCVIDWLSVVRYGEVWVQDILSTQSETHKLQQVSYHQADLRMRSHRLLRLDDITSMLQVVIRPAASCELHAGLRQVVSSTCSKSANIKLQV